MDSLTSAEFVYSHAMSPEGKLESKREHQHQEQEKTCFIAVLGLCCASLPQRGEGVGKSSLCARFVLPDVDSWKYVGHDHSHWLSQTDFYREREINGQHFVYYGAAPQFQKGYRRADAFGSDSMGTDINVIEHTLFMDDSLARPFEGADDYVTRATKTKLSLQNKRAYICRSQLGLAEDESSDQTLIGSRSGCVNIDGFIFTLDGTKSKDERLLQWRLWEQCWKKIPPKLKKLCVLVLTKCDIMVKKVPASKQLAVVKYFTLAATEKSAHKASAFKDCSNRIAVACGKYQVPVFFSSAEKDISVDRPFLYLAAKVHHIAFQTHGAISWEDGARKRREWEKNILLKTNVFFTEHVKQWRYTWRELRRDHKDTVVDMCCSCHGEEVCQSLFKARVLQLIVERSRPLADGVITEQQMSSIYGDVTSDPRQSRIASYVTHLVKQHSDLARHMTTREDDGERTEFEILASFTKALQRTTSTRYKKLSNLTDCYVASLERIEEPIYEELGVIEPKTAAKDLDDSDSSEDSEPVYESISEWNMLGENLSSLSKALEPHPLVVDGTLQLSSSSSDPTLPSLPQSNNYSMGSLTNREAVRLETTESATVPMMTEPGTAGDSHTRPQTLAPVDRLRGLFPHSLSLERDSPSLPRSQRIRIRLSRPSRKLRRSNMDSLEDPYIKASEVHSPVTALISRERSSACPDGEYVTLIDVLPSHVSQTQSADDAEEEEVEEEEIVEYSIPIVACKQMMTHWTSKTEQKRASHASEADAPLDVYAKNVRLEEALIQAPSWISGNTLALPGCAADGRLIRDGILLLERSSPVGGGTTYTCSCAMAANNLSDRQDESASEVISASEDSGKESAAVTCVHIRVAEKLIPSSGDNAPGKAPLESSSSEPAIDIAIVRLKPLFAWVKENDAVGVVGVCDGHLVCMSCNCTCSHTQVFLQWQDLQGIPAEEMMSGEDMTSSHTDLSVLSTEPIPYPLKCGPRIGMHLGDDFKTFMFVPTTSDECDTGFDWSDKDAVACKWQCTSKAAYITLTTFLDENIARQVGLPEPTVYYRECDGPCDCRKVYDGQLDFVLNVGNEFIIEHGVLLTHLHQMLEGHASLATLYRTLRANHYAVGTPAHLPYSILRTAWNGFLHLLDIDWKRQEIFTCAACAGKPKILVVDCVDLGFRQDLLPALMQSTLSSWSTDKKVKEDPLQQVESTLNGGNGCYKQHQGCSRSALKPGLMSVYCQHAFCIGFKVVAAQDSLENIWRLLKFKEAPKLIVSDVACQLHQLLITRQPDIFEKTTFAVDDTNWTSHKRCSETYRLSQHSDINKWEITTVQQDLIKSGPKSLMPLLACSALRDIEQLAGIHLAIRNMRIMSDLHCSTSLAQ